MKTTMRCLVLLAAIGFCGTTQAGKVVWVSDAMACVPTHETAEQQKYVTTAGGVKFKPEAFGKISFICPFSSIGLKVTRNYHLEASVRVTDASVGVAGVTAEVRSVDPVNGSVETALNTEFSQRSDSSTGRVATIRSNTETFGWNSEFTYYVQFTIRRGDSTISPNETLAEPPPPRGQPVSVVRLALVQD